MRVAVLKGGRSLERQVSLRSAARVEDALGALGHEAIPLDVGGDLVRRIEEVAPDLAFIALHGPGGEDGTPQELLEILEIPYTGSGVAACIRSMDKVLTKHLLRAAGIPTPDWVAFNSTAFRELGAADALPQIEARLGFPLVVKPAAQGSALGVRFAASRTDVPEALVAAFSYDDRVLLERHLDGRELAVSLLDGEPLPAVEVLPTDEDLFNYEARYEIGRTEYACPADLEPEEAAEVRRVAGATYELLGCAGFARVDLMLDRDGSPQVLEAQAIPGLTDTSLLPIAADAAGTDFEDLVRRIVELALSRVSAPAR
jgi:D-alanine-D-alanine ligase